MLVDQEQKENFVEIEKTALRCQKIIQNFIRFSKQSGFNEICNLNSITKETLPFLKTMMRSKTITMDLDSKNAFVQAEPCLLQQVIFNLIKMLCRLWVKRERSAFKARWIMGRFNGV